MRTDRSVPLLTAMLALTIVLGGGPSAQSTTSGVVEITTLSNRADLVSAGDVLVEVALPQGAAPADVVERAGADDVAAGPTGHTSGQCGSNSRGAAA